MRYIVPIIIMIAVMDLGCKRMRYRSASPNPPQPAGGKAEDRPLSELAPQPTKPKPPEPSAKPPPRPAPTPGTTYTVAKGDTFWSIAQQVYGDGKLWTKIEQANPGVDMNALKVGQVIKIPPK